MPPAKGEPDEHKFLELNELLLRELTRLQETRSDRKLVAAGISAPADASADFVRQILINPRLVQSVSVLIAILSGTAETLISSGTVLAHTDSQKKRR